MKLCYMDDQHCVPMLQAFDEKTWTRCEQAGEPGG
jgi:hypothetical protein